MNARAYKTHENKSRAVTASLHELPNKSESAFQFVDNRSETVAQRKLQETISNSSRSTQLRAFQSRANKSPQAKQAAQFQAMAVNYSTQQQQPLQKKTNNTGLPDNLKSGIENFSGYSMDDVRVHYNSDKPSKLQAHAYAQGADIHLGPGQEKHLPHEAWHLVQQKQGRVKPTLQTKDRVSINDDSGLEKEADVMGGRAMRTPATEFRQETGNGKQGSELIDKHPGTLAQRQVIQRVLIAGINVNNEGQMPTWEQNEKRYHINLTTATYHITEEGSPKVHYFYEGYGTEIVDKQPTKAERGGKSKKKKKGEVVATKRVFSKLPKDVQAFIRTNYAAMLKVK